jgi:hypothetical protein
MSRAKKAAITAMLTIGLTVTAVPSAEALTGPMSCLLPQKVFIASGPQKGWVKAWENTSQNVWVHEAGSYWMHFDPGVKYLFDYHSVYFTCNP